MPTIVERNPAEAELFASVSGSNSEIVSNLEELKEHLTGHPDEYAVILGSEVDLEAAASLAETLRVTRPATSVILVRRRVDTTVLAEALRSGMREVLEERDLTGLGHAVRRAADLAAALHGPLIEGEGSDSGKLVAVFSPKGGVGKTTLAVNLAIALAQSGQKACLVDLDLGFGDVAITLQIFPSRTIADTVYLQQSLDIESLESLLTPHGDNLFALAAPVQPDAKDSIPPALVGKILHLLKKKFDFVVVDTAPAFDEHILQAFDEADEILLVATLDVPTLKNVKMAIETLDLLNYRHSKRRLILNRADEKVGLTPEKVESVLNMKISQAIPASPQVATSTNEGEPIMSSMPRHPVSKVISELARDLVGDARANKDVDAVPGKRVIDRRQRPAESGRRGLLRRNGR